MSPEPVHPSSSSLMSTTPSLPQHTISLILSYISPPSQLSQALPPHLLSKSLLQRHHFLALTPQHPEPYLCWPSQHSHRVIYLLESIPKRSEDDGPITPYKVTYILDDEHPYAHVHIDSQLRIVFQYDGVDTWKYHNATLVPPAPGDNVNAEPRNLRSDSDAFLVEPEQPTDDSDENDYWNAYASKDDASCTCSSPVAPKKDEDNSEDVYWAQYAAVQGSGDSTRPSPLPRNQRLKPLEAIPFPNDISDQPPSPHTLSNRLYSISPRRSTNGSILIPSSPSVDGFGTDEEGTQRPPTESPNGVPAILLHKTTVEPVATPGCSQLKLNAATSTAALESELEETLRQRIRELYTIWVATKTQGREERKDSESFLGIVRDIVEGIRI